MTHPSVFDVAMTREPSAPGVEIWSASFGAGTDFHIVPKLRRLDPPGLWHWELWVNDVRVLRSKRGFAALCRASDELACAVGHLESAAARVQSGEHDEDAA